MAAPGWLPAIDHTLLVFVALAIKTSLIISICWACTAFMKQYSAGLRHVIWVLTLVGVLLLPVFNLVLPTWQILQFQVSPIAYETAATSPIANPKVTKLTPSTVLPRSDQTAEVPLLASVPAPTLHKARWPRLLVSIADVMLLIWLLGALAVLGWLFIDHRRLVASTHNMVHLRTGEIAVNLERIRKDLKIQRQITLYLGAEAATPMTWGLFKPIVALPADALNWRADRTYSVLYHELSHIRRYDYVSNLLCQFACALHWFNPFVWMAYRAAQFEQEKASDEQVLRSGVRSDTYAEHLLFVAKSSRQLRQHWGAMAMARAHALQNRIHSILFGKISQKIVSKGHVWSLSFLACSITSLLAVIQFGITERGASYIWLEAESGRLHGAMQAATDAEASAGSYIWAQEDAEAVSASSTDRASFRFNVSQPGNYIIWGRVQAHSGASNSFYVSVDDSASTIWDVYGPDSDHRAHRWTWDRVRSRTAQVASIEAPVSYNTYNLQPGWHTLSILTREKGTRIDHILITNDKAYRPRGVGKSSSDIEPAYIWLEAEDGQWRAPMNIAKDGAASNGSFVWTPEKTAAGHPEEGDVRFEFEVNQTDTYFVWGRVIAPSSKTNSFFIGVDGGDFEIWDVDAPKKRQHALPWAWERVQVRSDNGDKEQIATSYLLQKGIHSLALKGRESGTRIDRLLITNDNTYRPEGWGTSPGELVPTYLWIEAEDGMLTSPLSAQADTTASGSRYIAVSNSLNSRRQPPGNGRAVYHLDIPQAGTYLMWSRVRALNNDKDSFWVRMNQGPWIRWNGITHGDAWHWEEVHDTGQQNKRGVVSFELKQGRHMLEIAYREPSSMLDGFLLTNDLNFAPASFADDPIVLKREHLISAARSTN